MPRSVEGLLEGDKRDIVGKRGGEKLFRGVEKERGLSESEREGRGSSKGRKRENERDGICEKVEEKQNKRESEKENCRWKGSPMNEEIQRK